MQMKKEHKHSQHDNDRMQGNHYKKLLLIAILSFASMYILMYAMVNSFKNVFPNVNQFYMAGLMTSAMIAIELAIMGGMYMNKKWNAAIMVSSFIGLAAFFGLIREQ